MVWALSWSATSHRAQYSQEMWLTRNCKDIHLQPTQSEPQWPSGSWLSLQDLPSTLQSYLPAIIPTPRRNFCGQKPSSPYPWKSTERNVNSLKPSRPWLRWPRPGVCAWLIQFLVKGCQALWSPHAEESLIMRTAIVLSLPALYVTEHCVPPVSGHMQPVRFPRDELHCN